MKNTRFTFASLRSLCLSYTWFELLRRIVDNVYCTTYLFDWHKSFVIFQLFGSLFGCLFFLGIFTILRQVMLGHWSWRKNDFSGLLCRIGQFKTVDDWILVQNFFESSNWSWCSDAIIHAVYKYQNCSPADVIEVAEFEVFDVPWVVRQDHHELYSVCIWKYPRTDGRMRYRIHSTLWGKPSGGQVSRELEDRLTFADIFSNFQGKTSAVCYICHLIYVKTLWHELPNMAFKNVLRFTKDKRNRQVE